jgi:hypothetical protein
MLRPSALRKHLTQVTSGNIHATMLATRSGEVLDCIVRKETSDFNVKNVCATFCSIYQSFQKLGVTLTDNLNFIIVDCDEYRLAIRPVGSHLFILCADSNTGLGILKLKLNSISDSFSKLLNYSFEE